MATRYWVGGSGTWDASSTANWSASSGGAAGASAPNSADTAWFDTNSGTGTVSLVSGAACATFVARAPNITIDFQTNLTISAGGDCSNGTLKLNSYTYTCRDFSVTSSSARTIDFGTGKIVCSGNGIRVFDATTVTNMTLAGTRRVEFSYTGSTGTRTITCGTGGQENTTFDFFVLGGTDTILIQANGRMRTLDMTGFAGTLTDNGAFALLGGLVIPSGVTYPGGTNLISFVGASSTGTISCGITIDHPISISGTGLTRTLGANLVMGSTRAMTLTNGTLDAAGYNVTVGSFALGSGTKTLTLGSGTWTCAGNWDANTNVANLTVSASTGTISMTSASAKTFSGGGRTWPTLNQGGAGALTIAQSNTFANITNTVQPATIRFTAGTTQTVSAFSVSGTSGNLITLDTTVAGTQATLSDPSGLVSVSFCSIKDINATGGASWTAYTSNGNVNAGNNLGWDFNAESWSYMYNVRKTKRIIAGV